VFGVGSVVMALLAGQLPHARRGGTAAAAAPQARGQEEPDRSEVLLDGVPVGFALFDRRQHAVRVNAALAGLCSRPASQLLGQPVEAVLPAGPSPRYLLEQVFTTGQ